MGRDMARPYSKPPPQVLGSVRPCGVRGAGIAARRIASGLGLVALALTSLGAPLPSVAADTPNAADPRNPAAQVEERPLDLRWRARGVAFVDLPLGLRARYDARALHRLAADDLAAAFAGMPTGAASQGARVLESRFALSRVLAPRIELELSWAARSPLTMVDLLRIEDQRVAAMIRFVP